MRRKALKRKGMCRVWWGSHGCSKQRGHRGLHYCSGDCPPCDGPYVDGEDWDRDAYIAEVAAWMEHRRRKGKGWPTFRADDWRLPTRLEERADPSGHGPAWGLRVMGDFLDAMHQLVTDPGPTAAEAREASDGLIALAEEMM